MLTGDELELKIEKLSNLGMGIARYNGFVIFVENTCPEDIVKAKITKITKNFANAIALEIITPSAHRVAPFCPMQKICGACQLQFIDYDYQLELKRQIVQDTLHSIANLDIDVPKPVPSPEIKAYRHKIQYPVSQTKVSKRILAGYYKPQSHEIVNIKYCPIQPEICDEIIDFIRTKAPEYNISGYNEKTHQGELRHVVLRVSSKNQDVLVTLVVNSNKISSNLKKLADKISENFDKVVGVVANFNSKKTNVILSDNSELLCGSNFIEETLIDKTFKVGSTTFFQVNPYTANNIFNYVKNYIQNNYETPVILDAYAGISTFGICLSDIAKEVVCVETCKDSVDKAREVINFHNIKNIDLNCADAGMFLANETRKFDVIIIDPPRKGCTTQSLDEIVRLSNGKIIYVSCNPATLARDLKYLIEEKDFKLESIQPFDMFCHTYHIENVAIFTA